MNGFLNPHLLQVIALPYLDRLIRLIAMTKSEIVKMEPSTSSNGRFSIFEITTMEVVVPCGMEVRIEAVR